MKSHAVRKAMTIAGSDSGGGAGLQADLKTFAALDVYGTSVVTAITAQNTVEVAAVLELAPDLVVAQIDAIMRDIGTDAAKTGMLGSAEIVTVVAERVRTHAIPNLVVDPVLVASTGRVLLRADAVEALRDRLLPLAAVVTPNAREAEVLTGRQVQSVADAHQAVRALVRMGAEGAVVTGGHLPGGEVVDVLFDGQDVMEFRAPRVETPHTHGTGCAFSAALAAHLARGRTLPAAVAEAKAFVTAALGAAYPIGAGRGPVNHFFAGWSGDQAEEAH